MRSLVSFDDGSMSTHTAFPRFCEDARGSTIYHPTSYFLSELAKPHMFVRRFVSVSLSLMSPGGYQNEEAVVRKILTSNKKIALVGASNKPERPSNYVMKYLMNHGYTVIPVNPGLAGTELHGQLVYANLKEIPEKVDMVDIFRESKAVGPIVEDAIDIGAKAIWMQLGVVNEEAAKRASEAGLDVVMDTCPKIEIPRLEISGPSQSSL